MHRWGVEKLSGVRLDRFRASFHEAFCSALPAVEGAHRTVICLILAALSTYQNRNMTTQLSALLAQKEALERQIREAQTKAKAEAIAKVRELMSQHELAASDLVSAPSKKNGVKAGSKVAPKYRDPATGSTWTGRASPPTSR